MQYLFNRFLHLPFQLNNKNITSFFTDCIDLIDKYNGRSILFGLFEEASHSLCTNSDIHFNKLASTDRIKWNFTFPSTCLSDHSFSSSWRSSQKSSSWDPCSKFIIFFRVLQKIDKLYNLIFRFLHTNYIFKGNFDRLF